MRDILIDDNNVLAIENGDFVIGEDADQRVSLILQSAQGEWKQHPLVGVGIIDKLNSPSSGVVINQLNSDIRKQLEGDGLEVVRLEITEGNVNLQVR